MFDDIYTFLMVSGAVFGLVLCVWVVALILWTARRRSQDRKIELRMGFAVPEGEGRVLRLWHDGREATTVVAGSSQRRGLIDRIESLRQGAGWETPIQTLLLGVAGASLLVCVVTFLVTNSALVALCGMVAVVLGFYIYLKQAVSRRTSVFERQLVDALELAARSLRVGQPLVGSFGLIAEEIAAPVGPLFAAICQQQGLGVGLDDAIRSAANQSGSPDMKFFATSVVIQLRSGGNLADMMERLAFVIRDRMRLQRRVRVLTAQTQFSKRILQALPIGVFVLLSVLSPEYMRPLYSDDSGKIMLAVAGAGLMAGTLIMNRIAVIKY